MRSQSPGRSRVTLLQRLVENPTSENSWAEFRQRYALALRDWLLHWGIPEADASGAVDEVMARLRSELPKFRFESGRGFRVWLKTLAHQAWHDFGMSSCNRSCRGEDGSAAGGFQSLAAREDLAARLESTFDREILELALALAREQVLESTWEAFRLASLEGIEPREVARRLGIRVSQVYLARHRVQKRMRVEILALEGSSHHEG